MREKVALNVKLESMANTRKHWAVKMKINQVWRTYGYVATLSAIRDDSGTVCLGWMKGPLTITLTRVAPRSLDGDNLQSAFKSFRDGVADALGTRDNDPRLTWKYAQRKGRPREYAVEVELTDEPLATICGTSVVHKTDPTQTILGGKA